MKKKLASLIGISLIAVGINANAATSEMESAVGQAPAANAGAAMEHPAESNKTMDVFSKLDANHDGMIDKNEAKKDKALSKSFKKIAKNGKLDQQGFTNWESSQQTNKPTEKKS